MTPTNDLLTQFAMKMLQSNPQVSGTPMGQQFLQILQTGNVQEGQQLATNLCQTYGISQQEAIQQSRNYFHI